MKLCFDDFTIRYGLLFKELFFSDEFERYIYFFDRLIATNKIPAGCYKETDDIILNLVKIINDPKKASVFYNSQDCDYMFDFYHRYHILVEYLQSKKNIEVISTQNEGCFKELFLKTWVYGIPTFIGKNF